eukprot:1878201-Amphidinium_carterae.1
MAKDGKNYRGAIPNIVLQASPDLTRSRPSTPWSLDACLWWVCGRVLRLDRVLRSLRCTFGRSIWRPCPSVRKDADWAAQLPALRDAVDVLGIEQQLAQISARPDAHVVQAALRAVAPLQCASQPVPPLTNRLRHVY